jgi:ribosomal protein L40E
MDVPAAPGCALCGRPTYDPDRKEPQWVRAVSRGRQVLICPPCQAERGDWQASLDRCRRCHGTRLGVVLGEVVCRACGYVRQASEADRTARADLRGLG